MQTNTLKPWTANQLNGLRCTASRERSSDGGVVKLTAKQINTILRKIEIAERKVQDALTYVDKVTSQLHKYGVEEIIAAYHSGDGIMFQFEDDPMSDMDMDALVDYLSTKGK